MEVRTVSELSDRINRLEARPSCHLLLELAADQLRRDQPEKAGDLLDRLLKRGEAARPDQKVALAFLGRDHLFALGHVS